MKESRGQSRELSWEAEASVQSRPIGGLHYGGSHNHREEWMRLGNVLEAEWTGPVAQFSVQFGVKRDPGMPLKLNLSILGGGWHHLLQWNIQVRCE